VSNPKDKTSGLSAPRLALTPTSAYALAKKAVKRAALVGFGLKAQGLYLLIF